jgi:hypothetical protein
MNTSLNKSIIPDEAICLDCNVVADYMIWGVKPMKTYCLNHLQQARPSGTCYVFRRNGSGSFFIDGKFKS